MVNTPDLGFKVVFYTWARAGPGLMHTPLLISLPFTTTANVTPSQPPLKPLTKKDMSKICKCLYPLRAKWKTIGTFLCVEHDTLAAIKIDCEDSAEMLTELIAQWLKQIDPPPTGQALAEAVQDIDPEKAKEVRQIFHV